MKRPNQILAGAQIDSRLAANRAVNLGQQRCRYLNVWQSPQVAGGCKARDVSDHAASKGNQQSLSIGAQTGQSTVDPFNRRKRLVSFPFGKSNRFHFKSSAAQRTEQLFAMQGENCLA